VEILYEVPRGPIENHYMYQIASLPLQSEREYSVIKWEPVVGGFLGSGWRLAEIFEDRSNVSDYRSSTPKRNIQFIFEKPASRLHDATPHYEVTMVKHTCTRYLEMHGMGMGGTTTRVIMDWEPVLDQYALQGWQLVRVFTTPGRSYGGLEQSQKQLMFLQRLRSGFTETEPRSQPQNTPSAPPHAALSPPSALPPPSAPPPAYTK